MLEGSAEATKSTLKAVTASFWWVGLKWIQTGIARRQGCPEEGLAVTRLIVGHQRCARPRGSAYSIANSPVSMLKRVTPTEPAGRCSLKGTRSGIGCGEEGGLDEFVPPGELTSWQGKPADDRKLSGLFFSLSPSVPQATMPSLVLKVEAIVRAFPSLACFSAPPYFLVCSLTSPKSCECCSQVISKV